MRGKVITFLTCLIISFSAKAQTVIVNPDGTHSVIISNGNIKTIINSNGTHILIDNGPTKTIVNSNGTHTTVIDNDITKTIINPNGTHSVIISNGNRNSSLLFSKVSVYTIWILLFFGVIF